MLTRNVRYGSIAVHSDNKRLIQAINKSNNKTSYFGLERAVLIIEIK